MLGTNFTEEEIEDDYEWSLPNMTFAQYGKIKKFIELDFYDVAECQGE